MAKKKAAPKAPKTSECVRVRWVPGPGRFQLCMVSADGRLADEKKLFVDAETAAYGAMVLAGAKGTPSRALVDLVEEIKLRGHQHIPVGVIAGTADATLSDPPADDPAGAPGSEGGSGETTSSGPWDADPA